MKWFVMSDQSVKKWLGVVLACLLFWLSMFFGWVTLAQANFMYSGLYEVMSLDETIAQYGPENRYKKGFELTTDEERFRIFAEIVTAIHQDGEGLDEIRYHNAQGKVLDTLLRPPEVVHLQDVANLLDKLAMASWCVLFLTAMLVIYMFKQRALSFSALKLFWKTLAGVVVLGVVVVLYGAEDVFYQWHTLVFPKGHQWFFYYQDSLMTTMMRAPDLFAAIAVLWVSLGLIYFFVLLKSLECAISRSE